MRNSIRSLLSQVELIKTRSIIEGTTRLVVPESIEPLKFPSFFNPEGRYVRDVSIICYMTFASFFVDPRRKSADDLSFGDCLSGTGARGIRVANEALGFHRIFLNDISPVSIELARLSARENKVEDKCFFSNREAGAFLSARIENGGERFDAVDLDPFGTPSPFVDDALKATKHRGVLSVSATDTAVLCGVYPNVALRKYLGLPLRTDYSHEMGIRLMFGLLALTAMRSEAGIKPLFAHHDQHYFRTYSLIEIGNNYSRQNEEEIGYVLHCFKCGARRMLSRSDFFEDPATNCRCSDCESKSLKIGGPLWAGKIQSEEFVERCSHLSNFPVFNAELNLPLYYDLSKLCDEMGTSIPKIASVITQLKATGHSASRTRLNPKAVRTDAPLRDLRKILVELVR